MPSYGFAFPVLPGKDAVVREVAGQLKQRQAEYLESRVHLGCHVEKAYLQKNPDGSAVCLAYLDGDRTFNEALKILTSSDRPIDRYFVDKNSEVTGIDFRAAPEGPEPELIAQWIAPGTTGRGPRGLAFAAPLKPGAAEEARKFAREAYETRRREFDESRTAKTLVREEVYLNRTPMGDLIVVYMEGENPAEANRQFAASQTPYDRWFKDQCKGIFPPAIDFDQPVPANEEVFAWVESRSPAAAH
jgi:hypothetical protein